MKPSFSLPILALAALLGCNRATNAPSPEAETGKLPTSKVLLTYTGEIKTGDWIELDGLDRMLHKMDTSEAFVVPGQPQRVETRTIFPTFFEGPIIEENLWVSQAMVLGAMTGRWWPSFRSNGLPPISIFYRLSLREKNASPYVANGRNYVVSFEGMSAAEWQNLDAGGYIQLSRSFDKLTRLRIERTDGQPIRIRTSEGYAAKVEYQ
jgi:hypothetical protein